MSGKYYAKGEKKKDFNSKIVIQINTKFNKMQAFNQKKGDDFKKARDENLEDKYFYTRDKIYSYKTMEAYKENVIKACEEITKMYPDKKFKDINQFQRYVPSYIQKLIDDGKSAWTIHAYTSALSKLYGKTNDSWGVELPSRNRDNITRNRNTAKDNKRFSERLNPEVVMWAKNTGLRRVELENITKENIVIKDDKMYIKINSTIGKGGRERLAPVLASDEELKQMIKRVEKTPDNSKIWGKILRACPIHKYRGDYAEKMYNLHAKPIDELKFKDKYILRTGERKGETFDRNALKIVTEALGHSRLCVVTNNYL